MDDDEQPAEHLTAREREVLDLVRGGLTNEQIAERLGISLDGAKYHVSQILSKLGVSSRAEAAGLATVRRPSRGLVWASLALSAAAAVVIAALIWGAVSSGSGDADDPDTPGASPLNGAPRIGDHWHASYTFFACGEKQPNAPAFEDGGIGTHGDGIMHIHPFIPAEEGSGASMAKWFEYGGGLLTEDTVRLPGQARTWQNGDECPAGTPDAGAEGRVRVAVNGGALDDWREYIPRDGDRIQTMFGPQDSLVQLDDRQVIEQGEATRTIEMTVTEDEGGTQLTPQTIDVRTGETVRLHLVNEGDAAHGLRLADADREYGTADDFVVTEWVGDSAIGSDWLAPGRDGFTVIRFGDPGGYPFKDPTADLSDSFASGTIVVTSGATPTPTPSPPP